MSDLDNIKAKLEKAKENKQWPAIELATGVSQRTMYNVLSDKSPSFKTFEKLQWYFNQKKGKK